MLFFSSLSLSNNIKRPNVMKSIWQCTCLSVFSFQKLNIHNVHISSVVRCFPFPILLFLLPPQLCPDSAKSFTVFTGASILVLCKFSQPNLHQKNTHYRKKTTAEEQSTVVLNLFLLETSQISHQKCFSVLIWSTITEIVLQPKECFITLEIISMY